MSLRVLLVEDDRGLRATLRETLLAEGYQVSVAASLADARQQWVHGQEAPQLVLLDLGLPDGDGASLLALIRQRPDVPVLVISARPDEAGKIRLLDEGADDYLVKPFSAGELLARMRVALRHRGRHVRPATTHWSREGLEVDLLQRRVLRGGQEVHLTPKEYALLARLVRQAGQVVTHRQLLVEVWGPEHVQDTHYLRLYMGQLRAKLEADPAEPRWLLTETGVGYRLAD